MPDQAPGPDGGRPPAQVAVVIVNYRTPEMTASAVASVLSEPEVAEVVVVDNGSGDESPRRLRAGPVGVGARVLESAENLGFGRGVNLGVAHTEAPLVFLLNSDATVRPGALGLLSQALVADPSLGIVAPAVYEPDGHTLQPDAYGRLPPLRPVLRTGPPPDPNDESWRNPGWVSGVALMMRRSDFDALGGFDPDFMMYLEDVDLCRRLRACGRGVARVPEAAVVHLGGRSGGSVRARQVRYHRSKLAYLRKAGAGPVVRLVAATMAGVVTALDGAEAARGAALDRRRRTPRAERPGR